ncbi:Transcription initiation factor IIA gamma subunit [Penicillium riverlandense]|uniref:Transcription initiation factor IIA gamma subunit n=1 Tax=Penicillium riverlandense TaxID=1903569 RepID=UPI0025483D86|nr:Transcription initiation factor IIA gamma subunit [Penicillium riverlandense]KAJ5811659.1 Transcription initiation factor IIA gamma subunit [Penicillium riverlandense]
MPRTLPWLIGQHDTGLVKPESTPRKRIKAEPAPDHDQTPKNPPSSPDKRNFLRSSQTPPTSPIKRCPSEEFLIEGLDKDDAWIMVEDEFYAVAQTFTQHLHYAEYVRRTKEAKARNAASLGELDRPTDGRTALPKNVQRKHEAEELAARQKSGLGQVLGENADENEDTDEEKMWAGTHLHDLLTSPRKARSLAGVQTIKSATRAAAGYGQAAASTSSQAPVTSGDGPPSPSRAAEVQRMDVDEETATDEDDDLDLEVTTAPAPVRRQPGNRFGKVSSSVSTDKTRSAEKPNASSSKPERQPFAPSQRPAANVRKSRMQMLFDDLDELPAPSRSRASVSDRKGEQKSEHIPSDEVPAGNNDSQAKKARYNEVPTFLV